MSINNNITHLPPIQGVSVQHRTANTPIPRLLFNSRVNAQGSPSCPPVAQNTRYLQNRCSPLPPDGYRDASSSAFKTNTHATVASPSEAEQRTLSPIQWTDQFIEEDELPNIGMPNSPTADDVHEKASTSRGGKPKKLKRKKKPRLSPAISLGVPALKDVKLEKSAVRAPEEILKRPFTATSQRIVNWIEKAHLSTKQNLIDAIERLEDNAESWINKPKIGWSYRQLAVQYLHTQLTQHLEHDAYPLPDTIQELTNAILSRSTSLEEKTQFASGGYGNIRFFRIGDVELAVKTPASTFKGQDRQYLHKEIEAYLSLTPKQREGVVKCFGVGDLQKLENEERAKPGELLLEQAPHGNWQDRYKKNAPINYAQLKEDVGSVLDSLSAFHSTNSQVLIDFKPANVVIDSNQRLKICDLGSVVEANKTPVNPSFSISATDSPLKWVRANRSLVLLRRRAIFGNLGFLYTGYFLTKRQTSIATYSTKENLQ